MDTIIVDELKGLANSIYNIHGDKKEITDPVGNYCSLIIALLRGNEDVELFNILKLRLEKVSSGEMKIDDFISMKEKISKTVNNLLLEYPAGTENYKGKISERLKRNL
ncbi:MAG: hypothetical protein PHG82_03450 [Candidatus Gracilibacteria bacterium]|nr:hypothetical protein [Candidatus Gracilibacteria bacterium]